MTGTWLEKNERWLAGALLALAFLVRGIGLNELPPFLDESGHLVLMRPIDPHFFRLGKILGQVLFQMASYIGVDSVPGLRLFVALLGVITTAGVYRVGRLLGGVEAGLLAGLLWALQPMVVFHDRLALHDPMISLFYVWSLYAAVRALREGSVLLAAVAGLLSGLAALVKLPMILMAASVAAVAILASRGEWANRKRELAVFSIIAVLMVSPFLPGAIGAVDVVGQKTHAEGGLGKILDWLVSYNSWGFLAMFAACLATAVLRKDGVRWALLGSFLIPVFLLGQLLDVIFARYLLVTLVPLTVASGCTMVELMQTGEAHGE